MQKQRDLKPTSFNDEPCFSGRATYKDVEATPSNEEPCFSGRATEAPMGRDTCANAHSQSSSRIKSSNKTTEPLWEQQLSDNVHSCSSAMAKCSKTSEVPMELQLHGSVHSQAGATIKSSTPIEAPSDRELVESSHKHSSSRNKGSKQTRKLERRFIELVMNWKATPLLPETEPGSEDLEWLSRKSVQCSVNSDAAQSCRVTSSVEEPTHGSGVSSYQTRACYLPELEIYQLPYVVPF